MLNKQAVSQTNTSSENLPELLLFSRVSVPIPLNIFKNPGAFSIKE
jgi:hypothetical protein